MTTALVWPILVPLAGATAALLAGSRAVAGVGLVAAGGTVAAAASTATAVWRHGAMRHPVGGWGAPLGIDLVADGLSTVMVAMAGVVGAGISVYAAAYFAESPRDMASRFWPLWLFLWASLNALFLSGDVFNVYVALELLTLASVGLVVLAPGRQVLAAATRYLFAAFLASMLYLLGVALLYGAGGALDMETLRQQLAPGWAVHGALALVTIALFLKTALFPLHFWLPRAHAHAVTPVSAILSALVIKASFYVALRLWSTVFAEVTTGAAAQVTGALGACAIVWGGIQASRQQRLKLLVGYSTVSQIGYLFLVFPLAFPAADHAGWRETAIAGGVYHALAHACAKAAMFLSAGLMIQASQTDAVQDMKGVAMRLPAAVFAFGVAGLSVIGLPPSGGFVAKWLLLAAAIDAGQWWWAVVMLLGGLLTAGYIFLVLGVALTPAPDGAHPAAPVPYASVLEGACLVLALTALALGLRGTEVLFLLDRGGG